jgi:membrane protease YdiL (CAAX protease family)
MINAVVITVNNAVVIAAFSVLAGMSSASVFFPRLWIDWPRHWRHSRVVIPTVMGALGWYLGLINGFGALIFGVFTCSCALYPIYSQTGRNDFDCSDWFLGHGVHHKNVKSRGATIVRAVAFLCIVIVFFAVLHHKFPGFFNICALSHDKVSEKSLPYSMWFNFDRTFLAMILCIYGAHYNSNRGESFHRNPATVLWILAGFGATVTGVAFCALRTGYIEWDIKWPEIIGLWSLNNIFFVCLIEEIWFRMFLQGQIKQGFTRVLSPNIMGYRPHILAASVIFGIDHAIKGGPIYGILALLAGLFYGIVYDQTGRIQYAWAVHFLFNVLHITLFTYPASTAILSR